MTRRERELNGNGWQKLSIKIKSREAIMPEQNEGGYQPSEEEIKKTEAMLRDEKGYLTREGLSSQEREAAVIAREHFSSGAAEVEHYKGLLPEKQRSEEDILYREEMLEWVYGDGLPSNLLAGGEGLTKIIIPHWGKSLNLAEIREKSGTSSDHVKAAKKVIAVYDSHSQEIIAKSEVLSRLLTPLEPLNQEILSQRDRGEFRHRFYSSTMEQKVTDEDVDYLLDCFGDGGRMHWRWETEILERKKIIQVYLQALELIFGRLFRATALNKETPEEFSEYKKEMEEALSQLAETA